MKRIVLLLACAASLTAAQTPTAPPTPAAKPATAAAKDAKPAAPAKPATAPKPGSTAAPSSTAKLGSAAKPGSAARPASAAGVAPSAAVATFSFKVPKGLPPVRRVVKTFYALSYQDIQLGTGPDAEPGKMYKVHYTGWLASDGTKFDSSYERKLPERDKDGKLVMGEDGKPKMGEPHAEPIEFPQGRRQVIPGWDQGFDGMKVGGKRRLFIPWQLAYGPAGRPPVIPAKADLIFDIELLAVSDPPPMGGPMGGRPMPSRPAGQGAGQGANPGQPGGAPATRPGEPTAPAQPATPPATPPATTPATPTTPPQTPPPTTPQPAPTPKPVNPAQPQP